MDLQDAFVYLGKAWNKRYQYAYCDTTLQGDLKRKKRKNKQIFFKD
jgi:hypothetical protein